MSKKDVTSERPSAINRMALASNRIKGEWPLPPAPLIFKVIGTDSVEGLLESGAGHAKIIREMLARSGVRVEDFSAILDFGCGVARLLRHFNDLPSTELYGTDYNPELINWCKRNLPFVHFEVNKLTGGMPYENEKFDLVYLLSVFTHLDEAQQLFWLDEFARVLKPRGYLYFTMHGKSQFSAHTPEEAELFASGELVTRIDGEAGSNLFNSYASKDYVEKKLIRRYEIINFIPGGDLSEWKTHDFQPQDSYLLKKL